MRTFLFLIAAACMAATVGQDVDVENVIRRSAAAMEKDWQAAPGFTYVERDVQNKRNGPKILKAYQVYLIEGSNYNRLIAINDKPLAPAQDQQERQKMEREIAKRQHESPGERARRVARYEKERRQDHAMIAEMSKAFHYTLAGSERLDGHDCWVFDAAPDPAYQPKMRDAKVLSGMKGKLWVEKQHYHWAKVEGEVIRTVPFYGVLAKVSPGTKFVLEQAPLSADIWLPKHFSTKVNASALGFINENSTDDETYKDYKPIASNTELAATVARSGKAQ